jgi:hypothetical protein
VRKRRWFHFYLRLDRASAALAAMFVAGSFVPALLWMTSGSGTDVAVLRWPASEYRDNDFMQFWAGARALLVGADPYDASWWSGFLASQGSVALSRSPAAVASPYPLWTHLALVPLGLLPLALAALVWLVLQAGAIAIGLAALIRVLVRDERRRAVALLAGFTLAFQPTWLALAGGNITGLLFGILALALAAAVTGRAALAGSLLALLLLKPQAFLLVAPTFLLSSRARLRLAAGGLAVAVPLVVATLVLRPGWLTEWAANAAALQASHGSNATGWTLHRVLPGGPAIDLASELALVAVWALWWRERRPALPLAVAAAVPVSLFVAPHGWSYDQLHLLVPLTVAVALVAPRDVAHRTRWMVAFAGLVALSWLLYAVAFERGGEEWSAVTPVLFFAALVAADALARAPRRDAVLARV